MHALVSLLRFGVKMGLVLGVLATVLALAAGFHGGMQDAYGELIGSDPYGIGRGFIAVVELGLGWSVVRTTLLSYGGIWSVAVVVRVTMNVIRSI